MAEAKIAGSSPAGYATAHESHTSGYSKIKARSEKLFNYP